MPWNESRWGAGGGGGGGGSSDGDGGDDCRGECIREGVIFPLALQFTAQAVKRKSCPKTTERKLKLKFQVELTSVATSHVTYVTVTIRPNVLDNLVISVDLCKTLSFLTYRHKLIIM